MIGDLQHRITLENPKRTDNGRGGWTISYTAGDRMNVWASASLLSVGRQLQYQEWERAAQMVFIIRENPFLNEDTQILFNGVRYEVLQFGPTATRFIEIRAREV